MCRWILLFLLFTTGAAAQERGAYQIIAEMNALTEPFIVVIGDSLTAGAQIPRVCGLRVVNAGISGARASSFIGLAEEMTASRLAPKLVVVALGINDALNGYQTDFSAAYPLLVYSLPKVPLAVATLAPIDPAMSDGSRVNLSTMAEVDAAIRATAKYKDATLIDLGAIAGFETRDGIHPTEGSRPLWDRAIIAGIEGALNCEG